MPELGHSVCRLIERLYVCENCHRVGVISDFNDECRPDWTHGRMTVVESATEAASNILKAAFPDA